MPGTDAIQTIQNCVGACGRPPYNAITSLRKEYTVQQLSKAFSVSPSGYYAYLKRPKKGPSERDWRDKEMIQCLYD